MYPYDTTYSHTRYVSYNGNIYTCSTAFYCFLRLLAAAVRLHRTGTRACTRCVVVYPRIWLWRIFHRYFLVFVQVVFIQVNQNQTWNSMKQSCKLQRESVGTVSKGGRIISAVVYRCGVMRGSWSCCCIWDAVTYHPYPT